jgi:hypothetical protein
MAEMEWEKSSPESPDEQTQPEGSSQWSQSFSELFSQTEEEVLETPPSTPPPLPSLSESSDESPGTTSKKRTQSSIQETPSDANLQSSQAKRQRTLDLLTIQFTVLEQNLGKVGEGSNIPGNFSLSSWGSALGASTIAGRPENEPPSSGLAREKSEVSAEFLNLLNSPDTDTPSPFSLEGIHEKPIEATRSTNTTVTSTNEPPVNPGGQSTEQERQTGDAEMVNAAETLPQNLDDEYVIDPEYVTATAKKYAESEWQSLLLDVADFEGYKSFQGNAEVIKLREEFLNEVKEEVTRLLNTEEGEEMWAAGQ